MVYIPPRKFHFTGVRHVVASGPVTFCLGGSLLEPAMDPRGLSVLITTSSCLPLAFPRLALTSMGGGGGAFGPAGTVFAAFGFETLCRLGGGSPGKSPGRFLLASFKAIGSFGCLVFLFFAGAFGMSAPRGFKSWIFLRFGTDVTHSGRTARTKPCCKSLISRSDDGGGAGGGTLGALGLAGMTGGT